MPVKNYRIEDNQLILGSNEASVGLIYDYDIYQHKHVISAFNSGNSHMLHNDIADILDDDEMVQIMHSSCNYCRKPIPLSKINSIGVCESCMKKFHDEISSSSDIAISSENEFYIRKNIHKWEGVIGFKSGKLENKRHILTDRLILNGTDSTLFQYQKDDPKHEHLADLHRELAQTVAEYNDGVLTTVLVKKSGDLADFKIMGFYRFLKTIFPAE